eukprot:CAMPEP_0174255946 /NCGR_PEP_ID=MMETSP0439-20130205/5229_1 /TAXON_ID=0 /ORGANISM="Stereomyxa ramosa, Strain Chinc5" /LENGTH=181 /DNA_ID=CAMNT_0015338341 /DNA_START=99 /DNA_END=644 /DNA_ORIENTATION=-
MGNRFGWSRKEARVMMVGLANAGKTTVLYSLKMNGNFGVETAPTIGFNIETVQRGNLDLTIWDIGGFQDEIGTPAYSGGEDNSYYQGIIFVVDTHDTERIDDAKDELHKLMNQEDTKGAPLLILANKQDLPEALGIGEITEKLKLTSLDSSVNWYIQSTSAINGKGIEEGVEWFGKALANT